jgi:hypothetical protein
MPTDAQLHDIAKNAEAEVAATTISLDDWLNRIRAQKNYNYKNTAWYRGLSGLNVPDKSSMTSILDAAQRELAAPSTGGTVGYGACVYGGR